MAYVPIKKRLEAMNGLAELRMAKAKAVSFFLMGEDIYLFIFSDFKFHYFNFYFIFKFAVKNIISICSKNIIKIFI